MRRGGGVLLAAVLLVAGAPAAAQSTAFDATIAEAKAAMLADPVAAIARATAAERIADAYPPGTRRTLMSAEARWLRGEAMIRSGEVTNARPVIDGALRDVRTVAGHSRLEGDLLLSRGGIAIERGDVAGALTDYQGAHAVFVRLKDDRSRTKALIQIAMLYYGANDWSNALKYYAQALEAEGIDPGLEVSIRNGRGNALKELGRPVEAEREFARAITLARRTGSPVLIATILNNAARGRLIAGQVDAADRAIRESRRLTRNDSPPGFASQQLAIAAQVALQRRDHAGAARLVDQAFAGADLAHTTLADREAHRTGYEAYRALGRDDLALAHLTAWKRLDDAATQLARSNGAALMGARFDFANQELRIATLKADDLQKSVAFERARVTTQRWVSGGIAATTLIVIALLTAWLVTLRRSRDRISAANADLETSNSALGRALSARTEFLATTSHEIRTPLNGILGMTQVMLADRTIDAGMRDRLDVVHDAGTAMRALVDDLLDVAKMEAGDLVLDPAPFDCIAGITDACRMWREQAEAKGLAFTLDLADAPRRIVGDAGRLRQILFNLLSNAVKFTAHGAITVAVAGRGTGMLRIAVADTGIGIEPAQHDAIFEPFRQADAGTTRQFGGTGLGLAICRRIAAAMDGAVTVASAPGTGAVFTLAVPSTECASAPAAVRSLLIVERNPIGRAMLKTVFADTSILFAGDADEAAATIGRGEVYGVLIEEAAVRGEQARSALTTIADAARAADIETTLLWSGDAQLPAGAGIDRILMKPIARQALVDAVSHKGTISEAVRLVSQAA